jgi:hypothetical protein
MTRLPDENYYNNDFIDPLPAQRTGHPIMSLPNAEKSSDTFN